MKIENRKQYKRARKVLDFLLSASSHQQILNSKLREVFGYKEDFGDELREIFIIRDKHSSYSIEAHRAFSYYVNLNELNELRDVVTNWETLHKIVNRDKYERELKGLKNFKYNDKSHRLWNGVQNLKRSVKDEMFEQWVNYDIENCATTLMLSTYDKIRGPRMKNSYERFRILSEYVEDKTHIRNYVGKILGDNDVAKKTIAKLFNRARLSLNPRDSMMKLLTPSQIMTLKQDPLIENMRKEISDLWRAIRARWDLTCRSRGRLPSGKKIFLVYFQEERAVLDVVRNYVSSRGVKYLAEHDGWRLLIGDKQISGLELEEEIYKKTGHQVKIEMKGSPLKTTTQQQL